MMQHVWHYIVLHTVKRSTRRPGLPFSNPSTDPRARKSHAGVPQGIITVHGETNFDLHQLPQNLLQKSGKNLINTS